MNQQRFPNRLFIALTLLVVMLLIYPSTITSAGRSDIETAWQRALDAGAYDFTADVEQTLIPRPIPSMIGQTDQRVDMRLQGNVTLPDHARLRLQLEGAGLDATPIELV